MTEELTQIDPDKIAVLKEKVVDCLKSIYDPEIPVNIYELGLIYEIEATPFGDVFVSMTLTSPNCPVAGSMPAEVKAKISVIPEVREATVDITFEPPWTQEMMSEEAKLELGFM